MIGKSNEKCPKHNSNLTKLESFKDLKQDWNGNGAEPIPEKVISECKKIFLLSNLPDSFEFFPTATKSIQIEFEKEGNDYFEINIYEDRIEVFQILNKEEKEYTFDISKKQEVDKLITSFYNTEMED